ncbi:MAG: UbiA family prenyltransferase, partial [Alphaproteobacteria bacterium]|nr:UbiA family prenyltransferase [Alphaproteobacteria bacterium]
GLAACLLLLLPRNVLWVALLIIPGVLAYPMMKRWIDAPQVWLGITFNSGIWVAWIAVNGLSNITPPLLLYLGCICWTVAYDTVYALQDRSDDSRMGIRSLALTLGHAEVFGIFMLYLFCCVFWSILLYQASRNGAMSATWTFGISASVFALAWLYLWVCALRWYLVYRNANVSQQAENRKFSLEEQQSVANHGVFFRENAIFGFLIALSLL